MKKLCSKMRDDNHRLRRCDGGKAAVMLGYRESAQPQPQLTSLDWQSHQARPTNRKVRYFVVFFFGGVDYALNEAECLDLQGLRTANTGQTCILLGF